MKNLSGQVGVYRRLNFNHLKLKTNPLIPVGTVINWWTVLENDLYKSFRTQTMRACLVRCKCGSERIKTYGELRDKRSPSCGCKSRQRSIDTVWRDLYAKIKQRGWDFHLTLPQLKFVSQLPCEYCGKEPSNIHRVKYKIDGVYKRVPLPKLEIRYSGMDRVDSTEGYTFGNVVPCCFDCNGMKSKLPVDEFFALIDRIRSHGSSAETIRQRAASLFALADS